MQISEGRRSIASDDRVDLLLCLAHHLWIACHGEDDASQGCGSLEQIVGEIACSGGVRERRRTVSIPPRLIIGERSAAVLDSLGID